MNIPELKKLAEQYRSDKSIVFQMPRIAVETPCGTALCIAGQAAVNTGAELRIVGNDTFAGATAAMFSKDGEQVGLPWEIATKVLGLTGEEAFRLFYKTRWPDQFRNQPDTPALAAERIEHFIQTEGRE